MSAESLSHHCPFLNRSDPRCSSSFKLDRLRHALEFCFDQYRSCPHYAQQLAERQARRSGTYSLVQVTISPLAARHAQPQPAAA